MKRAFILIVFILSIFFFSNFTYSKFEPPVEKFINECKFNNMWTNISQENDFVFPHHHMTFDKCIISGVFYVKSPPEAKIWFYKNHQIPTIKSHKYNHMTFEEYYFESEQNRLILFTSDFMHGNKTQPKGEKIAISFNVEY